MELASQVIRKPGGMSLPTAQLPDCPGSRPHATGSTSFVEYRKQNIGTQYQKTVSVHPYYAHSEFQPVLAEPAEIHCVGATVGSLPPGIPQSGNTKLASMPSGGAAAIAASASSAAPAAGGPAAPAAEEKKEEKKEESEESDEDMGFGLFD